MVAMIPIDRQLIATFCRQWRIVEFSLFGSVLREDFRPDSDVDVLVTFAPETHWGLFDLCQMERELKTIIGRDVDLVTRKSVESGKNYIRKKSILENLEIVHAER